MAKVNKSRTPLSMAQTPIAKVSQLLRGVRKFLRQRLGSPMLRVADGDGESINGVCRFEFSPRQQNFDHMFHLVFFGMAVADHGFLDHVGRIFRHADFAHHRSEHNNAARLTKFQCGSRIFVDKGFFNRCFIGFVFIQHGENLLVDLQQAGGEIIFVDGMNSTIGDV